MNQLLDNIYVTSIVVFLAQVSFMYFRALNIVYTAELKVIPSIITNGIVGILWLVSVAIGVDALLQLKVLPIIGHTLGSAIGIYGALRHKIKQRNKKELLTNERI